MTLAIIIFLLATAVLMLITLPFVMMLFEVKHDLLVNIKFWSVVLASWAVVWFAVSYGS